MFMKQALMTMLQNRRHTIEHSWQVSLGFLVICADFAQFLRSFSTNAKFCADFFNYKNFCAGN